MRFCPINRKEKRTISMDTKDQNLREVLGSQGSDLLTLTSIMRRMCSDTFSRRILSMMTSLRAFLEIEGRKRTHHHHQDLAIKGSVRSVMTHSFQVALVQRWEEAYSGRKVCSKTMTSSHRTEQVSRHSDHRHLEVTSITET